MMKNLFKKSWFIGVVILGVMVVVSLFNLWILSLKLIAPYSPDTFWTLASAIEDGDFINILAYSFKLAFYVSIIPFVLSGYSVLKKNNWGLNVAVIYLLGFETLLIVFQSLNHFLSVFAIILIILNVVFTIGILVLMILRSKVLAQTLETKNQEVELPQKASKVSLFVFLIDFAAIIGYLTTFVIPMYTRIESGETYNAILMNVLLTSDTSVHATVSFFIDFTFFVIMLFLFASSLSQYFFDKKRFINQSKNLVAFAFFATLSFFLAGLTLTIYYTINGVEAHSVSYIPMLLMIVVVLVYAVVKGQFNAHYQIENKTFVMKYPRIEPLIYVYLLSAVTGLMLFLPIVYIQITFGSYIYSVNLTGFTILRDYEILGAGYQVIAYLLVVMLISVGIGLVIASTSYLSKYRQFNTVVKSVSALNVFFVFLVAISGYYFQIAQQINHAVILDIFDFYGYSLPGGFEYLYTIGTTAIYALIASITVLVVMYLRKAFDRDELIEMAGAPAENGGSTDANVNSSSNLSAEEVISTFDPCPALTEIDLQTEAFKADLEKRKGFKQNEPSLSGLVNFVVEYARNSKLHLSYTPEDIATFLAGLGASRLSILQGMSGTGKTSLPKIFSEAIFGNCEIIEVESSWKDKNELLGYYNEFSTKYTPKKFTLALYKAALNQEICTFILLDEMNLSRIEYYFSDFLSLMENEEDRREIKLVNIKLSRREQGADIDYLALTNGHTLKVPTNVWFIGTANRDESTFVISDKVYDRAHTMNFTKRAPKVRNFGKPIPQQYYDYQAMNSMFSDSKQNGTFDAENNELIKKVEALLAPFNISFGNRILKQIEDFVNIYKACFLDENVENEAIEKILLSKVVSKLEVKTIDDKEKLESEFEKLNLKHCVDFIKRLDND